MSGFSAGDPRLRHQGQGRPLFWEFGRAKNTFTGKRMELLRYVLRNHVPSVRALANALSRDYSNVHADVKALASAGLLEASAKGLHADYDAIETRITI